MHYTQIKYQLSVLHNVFTSRIIPCAVVINIFFALFSMCQAETINYLVIEDTARPLQIETISSPLQGGIVTDIVKAAFEGSPYDVNAVVAPRQRLRKTRSKITNWMSYSTGQDNILWRYQIKLFDLKKSLIIHKDSEFEFQSISNLINKKIILLDGHQYEELDNFIGSTNINDMILAVRAPTPSSALLMLVNGRGIAYVDYAPRAKYYIRNLGMSLDDFDFTEFSLNTQIHSVYLTIDSAMPDNIKNFISKRIEEMTSEGVIRSIIACYIDTFEYQDHRLISIRKN